MGNTGTECTRQSLSSLNLQTSIIW